MNAEAERRAALEAAIRGSRDLMAALAATRALALPQAMIVSGAIYQTLWNRLTGRPAGHGIKDYDLFYFDDDLSWEAEDRQIGRARAAFPAGLAERVEARNQARVHLWFEARFGEAYQPLAASAKALERFVASAFAVGASLLEDDRLAIVAPFGLADVAAMIIRPNPRRPLSNRFQEIARGVQERWPEVRVECE